MKKFRFPLESVKTVRDLHAQRAREAFTAELRLLEQAEDRLRRARERRRALSDSIIATRSVPFHSGELAAGLTAYHLSVQAEADAAKVRGETNSRLEQARERWMECRRQLEMVHRLEHQARLEHRATCEKVEQAALDEIGSMSLARASAMP
jgi:flagellar FliJ protein